MTALAVTRLCFRFTKQADLRWISHRDLARMWERLLRRADLNLAFSQGFHPKPKISFPSALTLGIEALDEVMELELVGELDLADVRQRIESQLPDGVKILSIEKQGGKTRLLGASYRLRLAAERVEQTRVRIDQLLKDGLVRVLRDGKAVECSCQDAHFDLRLDGDMLLFSLPASDSGASLRPSELLQQLQLEDLLTDGTLIQRTHVHLQQRQSGQAFSSGDGDTTIASGLD